ncbi:hypothetical protein BACPLE_03251 [Phocaeicola plebeius DSM 17135]|uniref:Uncharacterized protein n=1 Tax=Phocaeicola plebeius (strain DSM 17135 / JCM 12973 / CCUG 54634 / M2) TaxID=484018 RepID=B5D2L1_PHOPM|nr:hypothetical protein BACPLE_03251 [Phocaeicola plebeius DSM 17135]
MLKYLIKYPVFEKKMKSIARPLKFNGRVLFFATHFHDAE